MISKLTWYARRLMAMSPAEVLHRVGEVRAKARGRALQGWDRYALADGPLPVFPVDIPDSGLPGTLRQAADAAFVQTNTSSWTFLGVTWPGSDSGDDMWHLDPSTGRHWQSDAYCFDIPYRHADGFGDIKHVWEVNRLQHLVPIAALARCEGREDARELCLRQIESWLRANPPFEGVNWCSGIELSLRVVSLVLVISLLGPETIPKALASRLRAALHAHGVWLNRYPSRFSSANNHLIAEAVGLFVLGSLLADAPEASRWAAYGRAVLIEEVEKQIHADGVGAEQSPTYTAFTVEMYLLALRLARHQGDPFPEHVSALLATCARHLRWITDEGGAQPRIGDDDEGRVIISSPGEDAAYVSSVLGCLAAAVNAPDCAPPAAAFQDADGNRRMHMRNLVLGAPLVGSASPRGTAVFDEGGYTVFRRDMSGRHVMAVLDHGPLGYLSIAAHGHADALALWLHVDDVPVFVDAGTYLYHAGGAWRDRFRGTASHNTLALDEADQSRIAGPFNWSRKARALRVADPSLTGDVQTVTACHNGYKRSHGVLHRRTVSIEPECLRIIDGLEGSVTCPGSDATLRFLVNPDLAVTQMPSGGVRISRGAEVLLEVEASAAISLEAAPISRRFGKREETTAIVMTLAADSLETVPHETCLRVPGVPGQGDEEAAVP